MHRLGLDEFTQYNVPLESEELLHDSPTWEPVEDSGEEKAFLDQIPSSVSSYFIYTKMMYGIELY